MALAVGQPGFIFGGNTGITYDDLQQRRKMLDAIEARRASRSPQNLGEGLQALGEGILGGIQQRQLRKQEEASNAYNSELSHRLASSASDITFGAGAGYGSTDGRYTAADIGKPAGSVSADPADGDIYGSFIDTVKQGITNPYGLAAVAATGQRESGYNAKNTFGNWSDPSESGKAGQAGGIMSWRAERLANMRDFVARAGGDPSRPSPALQAQFFLNEDPGLVQRLNGAKSVEEAQQLMNNAWAFAGHDRPGGEAAARLRVARSYLSRFAGDSPQPAPQAQRPVQVASTDPAAGVAEATQGQMAAPAPTNRVALERAFAAQTAQRPPEMGEQDVAAIQARPADTQAVPFDGPGATIDPRDVAALTGGAPAAASVSTPAMAPGPAPVTPSQIQAHPQGGTVPVPTARPSSPEEMAQAIAARRQQGRTVPTQQISSTPNVGAASAPQRTPFDLVAGEALGGNGGALYYAGRNSEAQQTVTRALMERRRANGGQPEASDQPQVSPAVQRVAQATMEAQNRAANPSAPSATAYDGGQQSGFAQQIADLEAIAADPLASDDIRQRAGQKLQRVYADRRFYENRAYEERQAQIARQQGIEDFRTKQQIEAQYAAPPSGYQRTANGGLAPIPGGPNDPAVSFKPNVETFYDEQGREVKGYLDRNGKLVTVGGAKAASSGGAGVTTINPDGSITVGGGGVKVPPNFMPDPDSPGSVKPIPGGPGEQIAGELAARLGLADEFLKKAPTLRTKLQNGDASGPYDVFQARNNQSSEQAGVHRDLEYGVEALTRMLTGAGMNMAEATERTRRYLPTYTDSAASMVEKLDGLTEYLRSTKEAAMRGRGGPSGSLGSASGAPRAATPENDPLGLR